MRIELTKDQINILIGILENVSIKISQAMTIQQLMQALQTPVAINPTTIKTTKVKEVKKK